MVSLVKTHSSGPPTSQSDVGSDINVSDESVLKELDRPIEYWLWSHNIPTPYSQPTEPSPGTLSPFGHT